MQPQKGLSKHALSMKAAASTRLMQLRAVASPECGPERDCALALTKQARRAALTHKNGYTCHGCARRYAAHAWLRKQMLQKHPEKQPSRGGEEAQDTPDSDGETVQEEQEQKEFVCRQRLRVLKSNKWLTRQRCEPASIIRSEASNVEEQSVTAACPICSKEYHYRWLQRHMLTKHPCYDEPFRPRPRT
ncbi:hypothetical protein TRVL_09020 [Trypanosoma vivax]|nr:hypothetical protein TRVL_09020 [Trypanosoma vivax]